MPHRFLRPTKKKVVLTIIIFVLWLLLLSVSTRVPLSCNQAYTTGEYNLILIRNILFIIVFPLIIIYLLVSAALNYKEKGSRE